MASSKPFFMPIDRVLEIVIQQMEATGLRPHTINDYERNVTNFYKTVGIGGMKLSSMNVSNSTKLISLKCLRALLERCFTKLGSPILFGVKSTYAYKRRSDRKGRHVTFIATRFI